MCKLHLKDILQSSFTSAQNIVKNSFPQEVGSDYMEKINIQEGLIFLRTNYIFKQPTIIEAKQDEKKFVITIGQKGNTRYKNSDNQNINFKEGFTTISLFNKTQGFREFKTKEVKQVRLILTESFLRRNLQESIVEKYFYHDNHLEVISFSPTSLSTEFLVNDILNCKQTGELATFYIQAKTLELLSLELSKLHQNKENIFLDEYDKEAIYTAKEILINNLQNPPSIIDLAKQVHLNEFKLKKGFKQIFNTTPYKLLNHYKMQQAKTLLESSEYNINEIANLVGYKFASNFTHAFLKEFKMNPKELIKTRKYYY